MNEINLDLFHATDNKSARIILKEQKFIPGEDLDNEDFLGKGIYFFKEKEHAVMWNIKKAKEDKINYFNYKEYIINYAILKTNLLFKKNNFLDLDLPSKTADYNKLCRKFENIFGEDEEYKYAQHKDRAMINYLYKNNLMDGIYIIKKIFSNRVKTSEFNITKSIEREVYCVKDDRIIRSIEIMPNIEKNTYNSIKLIC